MAQNEKKTPTIEYRPDAKEAIVAKVAAGISHAVMLNVTRGQTDAPSQKCANCEQDIKYMAPGNARIRNVPLAKIVLKQYEDSHWVGQTQMHPECYEEAGEPYGVPIDARKQFKRK